jgi:hypothetical protein
VSEVETTQHTGARTSLVFRRCNLNYSTWVLLLQRKKQQLSTPSKKFHCSRKPTSSETACARLIWPQMLCIEHQHHPQSTWRIHAPIHRVPGRARYLWIYHHSCFVAEFQINLAKCEPPFVANHGPNQPDCGSMWLPTCQGTMN